MTSNQVVALFSEPVQLSTGPQVPVGMVYPQAVPVGMVHPQTVQVSIYTTLDPTKGFWWTNNITSLILDIFIYVNLFLLNCIRFYACFKNKTMLHFTLVIKSSHVSFLRHKNLNYLMSRNAGNKFGESNMYLKYYRL